MFSKILAIIYLIVFFILSIKFILDEVKIHRKRKEMKKRGD